MQRYEKLSETQKLLQQKCQEVIISVSPQFLQDAEALEFRELGNVQLIVVKEDVDDTVTIRVVEAIEVHCGEVHAHQRMDAT